MPLTKPPLRQMEALSYIKGFLTAYKQSPTRSEIGRHMGISRISAHLLINKLKRDGYISVEHESWRNLVVTDKGWIDPHWGLTWEESKEGTS